LDLSIIQGPISVAPCQTLVSRFATFASLYLAACALLSSSEKPFEAGAWILPTRAQSAKVVAAAGVLKLASGLS
jgi:hypothetical protein